MTKMTSIKTLVTAGTLLAVAGVALADPTVKLVPGGAKSGASGVVTVVAVLPGGANSDGSTSAGFTGGSVEIKYDATKVTPNTAGITVPTGWTNQGANIVSAGDLLVALTADSSVVTKTGTMCSIPFTNIAGTNSTLTLVAQNTSVVDDGYAPWSPAANQVAAFVNGAVRDLGAAIGGAPSTGPGKVVAVAAGGSLRLLDADTLADKSGFTAPAVGTVSGRPVFGTIGTQSVLAVGDDAGKLTIVDAGTGASLASLSLGAKVSTPAIDSVNGVVYAAVTAASGPASLVKVVGGAASPVATLAGSTVLGAPAVFGGGIAVGTEKGVESFRSDGTPQAGVTDAAGATIAPIVGPGGQALSANATNLIGFNVVTGAAAGATGSHNAGALSEAWYDAATDAVVFGTPSGKLLRVGLTSGKPALDATGVSTSAITAEPIVLGSVAWAEDVTGAVVSTAGDSLPLADVSAKALAATGRATGNDLIAATAAGVVASVAF